MTKVLIVDDNAMYRSAFSRNLQLRDYEVFEAENADEALAVYQDAHPEVIVTDLSMRTPNEGLDLIRAIRQLEPLVPIVMISAVGTFEEGAEASRLGAHSVISKSRLDEELESLYRVIESARITGEKNRAVRDEVDELAKREEIDSQAIARLRQISSDMTLHASVRGEAFDALANATEAEVRRGLDNQIKEVNMRELEQAEIRLRELVPACDSFDPDTRKEMKTAEYFFHRQGGDRPALEADFSRTIGFSFCFAVENEAKVRLRKRLQKFLSQRETYRLIGQLLDQRRGQLDLFYHQHLARLQQVYPFDFTIDNVRQVFIRILEHESRYKPDGLKALGIIILCFGRSYTVKTLKQPLKIDNPLNMKGLETEEEVIKFAHLLVSLQHYRNPYIHPEISEMEKISKLRETAIMCLNQIAKIS